MWRCDPLGSLCGTTRLPSFTTKTEQNSMNESLNFQQWLIKFARINLAKSIERHAAQHGNLHTRNSSCIYANERACCWFFRLSKCFEYAQELICQLKCLRRKSNGRRHTIPQRKQISDGKWLCGRSLFFKCFMHLIRCSYYVEVFTNRVQRFWYANKCRKKRKLWEGLISVHSALRLYGMA